MDSISMSRMRSELEKSAQLSAEDVPWYTTAAGATSGLMAAKKFLPKKYQAVGQIGGALLGTGAGLAVGKPIAKRLEKKAEVQGVGSELRDPRLYSNVRGALSGESREERIATHKGLNLKDHTIGSAAKEGWRREPKELKPPHPALTAAKMVGGLGVGTAVGYGGMEALDAVLKKTRGRGLPKGHAARWAVPLVAGAGGMAYSHLQQRTLEKMRQDHLKRQEKKRGSEKS